MKNSLIFLFLFLNSTSARTLLVTESLCKEIPEILAVALRSIVKVKPPRRGD